MDQIRAIQLTPFEGSSTIAAYGHDPVTETLRIQFHKGPIYRYAHVPAELMASMLAAPSFGKAFVAEIKSKPDLYPYMKEDHPVSA